MDAQAELYLPLVRAIASEYWLKLSGAVEWGDLYGDGCVGLVQAMRRYDSDRSVPFRAYARPRICGAIGDGLRQMDRLTRHDRRNHPFSVSHVSLSWHPCAADSALLRRIGNASADPVSAFDPVPKLDAERALRLLSARSARILRDYYWGGKTMREIGANLGISEGRVSKLRKDAILQLRASYRRYPKEAPWK